MFRNKAYQSLKKPLLSCFLRGTQIAFLANSEKTESKMDKKLIDIEMIR